MLIYFNLRPPLIQLMYWDVHLLLHYPARYLKLLIYLLHFPLVIL